LNRDTLIVHEAEETGEKGDQEDEEIRPIFFVQEVKNKLDVELLGVVSLQTSTSEE
jgi:hypothetical protein